MEPKKSKRADLESKKPIFLEAGFIVVLAATLFAFEWSSKPSMINTLGELANLDLEEEIIPITRQQEVKPPPPPPPKPADVFEIVEDDVEIEDELMIADAEADQNMEIEIVEFEEIEEEVAEDNFFVVVENMPTFQGQEYSAFRSYISENLRYPDIAAENGIGGRVIVQFVVNTRGEVVNAEVLRGSDPALDQEALRVVMSSPLWEPGKQRGRPANVQFTFPINFLLN